jgi:hypothetical protein
MPSMVTMLFQQRCKYAQSRQESNAACVRRPAVSLPVMAALLAAVLFSAGIALGHSGWLTYGLSSAGIRIHASKDELVRLQIITKRPKHRRLLPCR